MFSVSVQTLRYIECSTMENRNIPYELSDYVLGQYFRETGERQGWLKSPGIIASVSGGGDSIALLWLCSKFYGGRLAAVHINHGIRGEESDGDEDFTASFAERLGIISMTVRISVPDERMKGESIESAARRLRHYHICRCAETLGIKTVLLGHNRDDLAETVLFNILRGTGIRGSVGMTECSELEGVKFYRPLLGLRREFLRDILRVRGISWREDSTNSDNTYTRNYIRLKLLPQIERKINASAAEHLAAFGEDMRKIRDREDNISLDLMNDCLELQAPVFTLNRKKLRGLNDDDTALVIREAGRRLGLRTLSRGRCVELVRLIKGTNNFIFQWCNNITAKGTGGKIIIDDSTRNTK